MCRSAMNETVHACNYTAYNCKTCTYSMHKRIVKTVT